MGLKNSSMTRVPYFTRSITEVSVQRAFLLRAPMTLFYAETGSTSGVIGGAGTFIRDPDNHFLFSGFQ